MRKFQGMDLTFDLTGKVAIVTGGGSGIGKCSAQLLHEKGAKVILVDVCDNLNDIAKEIGENAVALPLDITNVEQVRASVDDVEKTFGSVDILLNIAGLGHGANAEDVEESDWDRVMNVNLKGSFFMAQAVGRKMIASGKGGKIVNMASQAALIGLDKHALYGATKAGIVNLTKVMANEWGKYDINVNAIAPTVVLTPMAAAYWKGKIAEEFLKNVPVGRFAQPEEVAAIVLYLSSPASDMLTGETIVIDGGFSIR